VKFRSDPNKPGSDAWAHLDAESVQFDPRLAALRRELLAIRRYTAATWGSRGYTGPTRSEATRRSGEDR
jgi:hypothetical protein